MYRRLLCPIGGMLGRFIAHAWFLVGPAPNRGHDLHRLERLRWPLNSSTTSFQPLTERTLPFVELASVLEQMSATCYAPAPVGEAGALGGHRRPSSVCPSVRLSDVAYIGSNSKTKRPRKTKLCTGVPQVTCDSHTDPKVKSQGHGAGAYCGGHLAAQLVLVVNSTKTEPFLWPFLRFS